jgi:hypothetical protein
MHPQIGFNFGGCSQNIPIIQQTDNREHQGTFNFDFVFPCIIV